MVSLHYHHGYIRFIATWNYMKASVVCPCKDSGGQCTICRPDGSHVGAIPKKKGLYCVAHNQSEEVNSPDEELSLDQFHRWMGHISARVTWKLIEKGFVTGIQLKLTSSGEPYFCKSCMYAKATWKPVLKTCDGECTTKFGNKIYSDLWGAAPVATKGGKK